MSLDHTHGEAFRRDLTALIPRMRAFARGLTGGVTAGDDLAQDGLLKAWSARASFTPGTDLKSWVFTIMRNLFYSEKRRSWRSTPLDQEMAERKVAIADTGVALELDELRRAMQLLSDEQREALILIGAGGCTYEEVATMCDCAVGTIKSRVSRARDHLALIYAEASFPRDDVRPSAAMANILAQFDSANRTRLAA